MERHVFWREPYQAGVRAGRADRYLGLRANDYSWHGALDETYSYSWHYSRGYRDGYDRLRLEVR